MPKPVIYHIDVNSAFLSWEAARRLEQDESAPDIRTFPAVIGGDEQMRRGIVLAKSPSARSYGIHTGEPLAQARRKCPQLQVYPPDYTLYVKRSREFMELLKRYAPETEAYSIDEAFCDMTGTTLLYGDPVEFAHTLKDKIREELHFTVNIGVSSNRLLAKMASDFEKPDRVHTLFLDELADKLWPLPVDQLFSVGESTAEKLRSLGIDTIGKLAHADCSLLRSVFKSHGETIWNYANGVESTELTHSAPSSKCYGNSMTIHFDVTDADTARRVLLSLCETVGARLRADHAFISVIQVQIVYSDFRHSCHQATLPSSTNVTERLYENACALFDAAWDKKPIRLLGVSTSRATHEHYEQYSLFDRDRYEKLSKLNSAVDSIRTRFGEDAVKRACFVEPESAASNGKGPNEDTLSPQKQPDIAHMAGGMSKAKRTKT